MRLDQPGAEDLLRDVLGARATEVVATLGVEDVVRSAAARRHHATRRRVLLAAAAVVLVVGAPAAILLRPGAGTSGPAATPTPTGPDLTSPPPSPTTKAPAGGAALRLIPQGRPPGVTYLHAGTVYLPDGSTTDLPDPTAGVTDFTSYHGGWLVGVGSGDERVRWYDSTGARRSDGPGIGFFAVSDDGTRTAYAQSGAIHIGITSGMGNGEQTVATGHAQALRPVGFLRNGELVYQARETQVAVSDGSTIPGMVRAHAVSAEADLVAGEDAGGNTLVVAPDGSPVWTSVTWSVWAFSADGRYAAATHTDTQPDYNAFAILDARTGRVVAEHDALPLHDAIGGTPVMDEDGSLLVAATSGNLQQTVLRLDRDGTVTRATRLFGLAPSSDMEFIDFASRP